MLCRQARHNGFLLYLIQKCLVYSNITFIFALRPIDSMPYYKKKDFYYQH